MTTIELGEEDIEPITAVLRFSISAYPLGGINQDIEIDKENLENLISKAEKGLQNK